MHIFLLQLIKVDTQTGTSKTWSEVNVFPSEPIFVSSPDPQVSAQLIHYQPSIIPVLTNTELLVEFTDKLTLFVIS